ncbi:MAG: hypothetical protein ACXV3F_00320 [Frankiaceae bacterium]
MDASVELPLLAKRLKAAGEVGIRREMVAGLRNAAKPMIPYLRGAAGVDLPQGGGLAEKVATQPIKASVRTSPRTAGVSIRAQFTRTNRGRWRHPVFGNRDVWVSQTYEPAKGWFDNTAKEHTPEAKAEMEKVLLKVTAQVHGLGI